MSVVDRFEHRTIEIFTTVGAMPVPAFVLQEWAVHKSIDSDKWRVSHLPTGASLPFKFEAIEEACECAERTQRLRNDWSIFKPSDITDDLSEKIKSIVADCQGMKSSLSEADRKRLTIKDIHSPVNGYVREAVS